MVNRREEKIVISHKMKKKSNIAIDSIKSQIDRKCIWRI